MTMDLDFRDPLNANGAVKGRVFNRVAFDTSGALIVSGNDTAAGQLPLPDITFVLNGDVGNLNPNGEMSGEVFSSYVNTTDNVVDYESGNYYAILAGDTTQADGGEIVGIMVLESSDPRPQGGTAQETGGFILYR